MTDPFHSLPELFGDRSLRYGAAFRRLSHQSHDLVSDGSRRYRQYAGLALVLIAYVGGIIGWSCAVVRVDAESSGADSTQSVHQHETPPEAAAASSVPATRIHVAPTHRATGPRASTD